MFRDSSQGEVLAEVSADDRARSLSLAPGRYFVRGRMHSHVLEGSVQVEPSQTTRVDADALTRIEYARLVRKGGAQLVRAHALELLGSAHGSLPNADTPCYGAIGGYRMDLEDFGWMVRAGFCSRQLTTSVLGARAPTNSRSAYAACVPSI